MVRSASTRTAKFNAKWAGDVTNQRITEYKEFMVEQINVQYPIQARVEQKIKDYLEPIGMYSIDQHHYMNFGQEVWAKTRHFSGTTLRMEVELIASKWLRRGLQAVHLMAIAARLGVNLSAVPP